MEETAEVLKVSSDSIIRDWRIAGVWLLAETIARAESPPVERVPDSFSIRAGLVTNPVARIVPAGRLGMKE